MPVPLWHLVIGLCYGHVQVIPPQKKTYLDTSLFISAFIKRPSPLRKPWVCGANPCEDAQGKQHKAGTSFILFLNPRDTFLFANQRVRMILSASWVSFFPLPFLPVTSACSSGRGPFPLPLALSTLPFTYSYVPYSGSRRSPHASCPKMGGIGTCPAKKRQGTVTAHKVDSKDYM